MPFPAGLDDEEWHAHCSGWGGYAMSRSDASKRGAEVVGMEFQHLPDLTASYYVPLPEVPRNHVGKH